MFRLMQNLSSLIRILPLFSFVALAALTSCADTEHGTEVVVAIATDLEVGRELTALRLTIQSEDSEELRSLPIALAQEPKESQQALPLTLSIAAESQKSHATFRVVVTGRGPRDPSDPKSEIVDVVEQQAIVGFIPGRRPLLELFLARRCLELLCQNTSGEMDERSCSPDSGVCVPVYEADSSQLPEAQGDGLQQVLMSSMNGEAAGIPDPPAPEPEPTPAPRTEPEPAPAPQLETEPEPAPAPQPKPDYFWQLRLFEVDDKAWFLVNGKDYGAQVQLNGDSTQDINGYVRGAENTLEIVLWNNGTTVGSLRFQLIRDGVVVLEDGRTGFTDGICVDCHHRWHVSFDDSDGTARLTHWE